LSRDVTSDLTVLERLVEPSGKDVVESGAGAERWFARSPPGGPG
jgi:hypothetical protein